MTGNEFLALNIGEYDLIRVKYAPESLAGRIGGVCVPAIDSASGGFYLYPGFSRSPALNFEKAEGKSYSLLLEWVKHIDIVEKDYFYKPWEDHHLCRAPILFNDERERWEHFGGEEGARRYDNLHTMKEVGGW